MAGLSGEELLAFQSLSVEELQLERPDGKELVLATTAVQITRYGHVLLGVQHVRERPLFTQSGNPKKNVGHLSG